MHRWYCAQAVAASTVAFAASELANQRFDSFCPLHLTDKSTKPLFGSYFFVAFDVERDRWRSILGTRGVKTVLGLLGDRPNPLAIGIVEDLQRRAETGEFDERMGKPGLPKLAPDTPCRVGHFDGIVRMDMGKRVRVLLTLFGTQREQIVKRELLEVA